MRSGRHRQHHLHQSAHRASFGQSGIASGQTLFRRAAGHWPLPLRGRRLSVVDRNDVLPAAQFGARDNTETSVYGVGVNRSPPPDRGQLGRRGWRMSGGRPGSLHSTWCGEALTSPTRGVPRARQILKREIKLRGDGMTQPTVSAAAVLDHRRRAQRTCARALARPKSSAASTLEGAPGGRAATRSSGRTARASRPCST